MKRSEEIRIPTLDEVETQKMASMYKQLSALTGTGAHVRITGIGDDATASDYVLPPEAVTVVRSIVEALARGIPLTVTLDQREMTTREAADYLGVSRPFVVKEMDSGRLPHKKVGSHRRVLFEDLLAYAESMRVRQRSALDDLADNARELGLAD